MCDLCYHFPCLYGCPNSTDDQIEVPERYCDGCGEPIKAGEEFLEIDSMNWCASCLEEMDFREILGLAGYSTEKAV